MKVTVCVVDGSSSINVDVTDCVWIKFDVGVDNIYACVGEGDNVCIEVSDAVCVGINVISDVGMDTVL